MRCPKCGRETATNHLKWAEGSGGKRHEVWDCPAGNMTEATRRLARYDEMFSLLKEAANDGWFSNKDLHDRLQTFLAAEGKVAG